MGLLSGVLARLSIKFLESGHFIFILSKYSSYFRYRDDVLFVSFKE